MPTQTTTHMPKVLFCNVQECAYNEQNACHAAAITVDSPEPLCDTFFQASKKGGMAELTGAVGACKNDTCVYNESFECSASGINVFKHGERAECETYTARSF